MSIKGSHVGGKQTNGVVSNLSPLLPRYSEHVEEQLGYHSFAGVPYVPCVETQGENVDERWYPLLAESTTAERLTRHTGGRRRYCSIPRELELHYRGAEQCLKPGT